jgi:hypothetical protein
MATEQQRQEIRFALDEIERLEQQLKVANQRFDALLTGVRQPSHLELKEKLNTEELTDLFKSMKAARQRGKAPDPNSLAQRVLAEVTRSPEPVAISALAVLLKANEKQIRNAIVQHQKKGVLVHAGKPEHFTLKGRMLNGNGAHAEAK